jgi:ketosteroid isomerase-like protein
MPSRERVTAFVSAVREGRYVDAIADFYAEDATMSENGASPRSGRDALIAQEKMVLGGLKAMTTRDVGPVLVDGNNVVVKWVFEMTGHDGSVRRMEELALQIWRDDRIVEERFYYDPGQLAVTHTAI